MQNNYIIVLKICRLESTVQFYIHIYNISFKTNNSLEINLNAEQKIKDDENKFLARGNYQLTCLISATSL